MKVSLEAGVGPGIEKTPRGHRDWSARSIISVLTAATLLAAVYLLAGIFPGPQSDGIGRNLLVDLLGLWILGGLLTVTLLMLSDRRHSQR